MQYIQCLIVSLSKKSAGTRLGKDFGDCWDAMQEEAQEGAAWLGEEEAKGSLSKDAVSSGEGSCAAGKDRTRAKI